MPDTGSGFICGAYKESPQIHKGQHQLPTENKTKQWGEKPKGKRHMKDAQALYSL